MPKKKKPKIPPFIKFLFVAIVVLGIGYAVAGQLRRHFMQSDFFKIQSIVVDPSLQFIDSSDLKYIIGKNIFTVDLRTVKRQLSHKYPQASDLRVNRRFPNQVSIVAKRRVPFIQIPLAQQTAVLDEEGVLLSLEEKPDKDLPIIVGSNPVNVRPILGLPFRVDNMPVAVKVMKLFSANNELKSYSVAEINIANMSKIYFTLTSGLQVIIDKDDVAQKMRILSVILAQDALDFKDIKYVDLRFKEPIIGKK